MKRILKPVLRYAVLRCLVPPLAAVLACALAADSMAAPTIQDAAPIDVDATNRQEWIRSGDLSAGFNGTASSTPDPRVFAIRPGTPAHTEFDVRAGMILTVADVAEGSSNRWVGRIDYRPLLLGPEAEQLFSPDPPTNRPPEKPDPDLIELARRAGKDDATSPDAPPKTIEESLPSGMLNLVFALVIVLVVLMKTRG